MLKITNIAKGPRGVNAVGGPVLIDPDQTAEVEVYAREKEHIDATGWFQVKGEYQPNPGQPAAAPMNDDILASKDAEIAELRKQLAAKAKPGKADEPTDVKTAADVLALADGNFMAFKSAASKLLGDKTPEKKAEIVAALEDLATKPE